MGTMTMWNPRDDNGTIDYIFKNEHFETLRYEVFTDFDQYKTLASDHRPIRALLKWKQK